MGNPTTRMSAGTITSPPPIPNSPDRMPPTSPMMAIGTMAGMAPDPPGGGHELSAAAGRYGLLINTSLDRMPFRQPGEARRSARSQQDRRSDCRLHPDQAAPEGEARPGQPTLDPTADPRSLEEHLAGMPRATRRAEVERRVSRGMPARCSSSDRG